MGIRHFIPGLAKGWKEKYDQDNENIQCPHNPVVGIIS